ncbi:MAG: hypothetical protein MRJ92_03760 [Nitrospira sp.]|nr:hypothetical protein [Nitrospira sp.]
MPIPRKYREVLFLTGIELIHADWATLFQLASVGGLPALKWKRAALGMRRWEITKEGLCRHRGRYQISSKARLSPTRKIEPKLLVLLPDLVPLNYLSGVVESVCVGE